jgi:MFS family permease
MRLTWEVRPANGGACTRDGGKRRGRLGPNFGKLWQAQGVSNLGDGVYVTALSLLAATLSRDPLPVSAVMVAEWLPWLWLLFGLLAGALLDRWERRQVMWMVDTGRLVVVGSFAAAVRHPPVSAWTGDGTRRATRIPAQRTTRGRRR